MNERSQNKTCWCLGTVLGNPKLCLFFSPTWTSADFYSIFLCEKNNFWGKKLFWQFWYRLKLSFSPNFVPFWGHISHLNKKKTSANKYQWLFTSTSSLHLILISSLGVSSWAGSVKHKSFFSQKQTVLSQNHGLVPFILLND